MHFSRTARRSAPGLGVWLAAIFLIALQAVILRTPAGAANIEARPGALPSILISGTIEEGDYTRFQAALRRLERPAYRIDLASPGGDLTEAMRIGRLARRLLLTTAAPHRNEDGSVTCSLVSGLEQWGEGPIAGDRVPENCLCASACFLIYAAGIGRDGNILALHRPRLAGHSVGDLSLSDYEHHYASALQRAENYMRDMGLNREWVGRLEATPSGETYWLSNEEAAWLAVQTPPEIEEWLTARCGWMPMERQRRLAELSPDGMIADPEIARMRVGEVPQSQRAEYLRLWSEAERIGNCQNAELKKERRTRYEEFFSVVQ